MRGESECGSKSASKRNEQDLGSQARELDRHERKDFGSPIQAATTKLSDDTSKTQELGIQAEASGEENIKSQEHKRRKPEAYNKKRKVKRRDKKIKCCRHCTERERGIKAPKPRI